MDVFISWNQADKDVKNVFAKKFQEAGISYWDSDQKCTSDYAAECTAAIRQCGVFLALVSDAAMENGGFVQNEITTARKLEGQGKLNILVYKITENPYNDAFEFLLNHISFVTGNFFQRQKETKGSGIDTIVKRVHTLLENRRSGTPEKPFDVHVPEIDGLQLGRNSYFVEDSRNDVLEEMENGFSDSNTLILSEFVGYGKRSVVRAFAQRNKDDYDNVIMVSTAGGGLRDFFLNGLHFANLNERLFTALEGDALLTEKFKFLNRLDRRTLLVIPDVKLEAQPDPLLCQLLAGVKCRVVILTPGNVDGYEDIFPVIRVGRMRDEHLYELFFHHYACNDEYERAQLREPLAHFFDNIGGHTKTVELTASVLNRDLRIPPEEVPHYLSMQGSDGLQLRDRILGQIENIFDVEMLTEDAVTTLLVASCIAVPNIAESHFYKVLQECGVEQRQIVSQLDEHRWLDLDERNRTVSIEPLVAQAVLARVPEVFATARICLDFLISLCGSALALSASAVSAYRNLNKIGRLLRITGFEVGAQVIEQYVTFEDTNDTEGLQQALVRFEEQYPFIAYEEDGEESDYQAFENAAVMFIRPILPVLKMETSGRGGFYMDYSAVSNQILAGEAALKSSTIEDALGISKEEFAAFLTSLRNDVATMRADDEESETLLTMECLAMMDGFMARDFTAIATGAERLLGYIGDTPEVLLHQEYIPLLFPVLQMLGRCFLASGTYSFAIRFCEKMLSLPMSNVQRLSILPIYIFALRNSGVLSQELLDAYRELLAGYDCFARDVFANREDAATEKKQFLLMYAEDLAQSGQPEEAVAQFATAQKMTEYFQPEEEVDCAKQIVEAFVRNGDFDCAVTFIDRHFPEEIAAKYQRAGDERIQSILADFALYQTVGERDEFAEDADPKKYVSYYQAFSRKNNSLLEQKYLSVADAALDYDFSDLSDDELAAHAETLRRQTRRKTPLQLAPEAFALAGEVGYRVLGYRPHYVQFMGAAAMADGKIAEILNGEGKTYTIVLTAFLQYLFGRQVFVVDESSYLTERNYMWMHGVYKLLGVPVFYANDSRQIPASSDANVTYVDLTTLVFGCLNYELEYAERERELRLDCLIIDEADTTLVDMAAQNFWISAREDNDVNLRIYQRAWDLAQTVLHDERYYTYERGRVILQPAIYPLMERCFCVSYADMSKFETLQQAESAVRTAILCCGYYEKERDYFIVEGVPVCEDRHKGVFRAFSADYDYFLCKENGLDTTRVETALTSKTLCRNCTSVRDLFLKFKTVCGTTATAVSFREEFKSIYDLNYVCIPPHSPCVRQENQSGLYISKRLKVQAILALVQEKVEKRQPVLLITQSVAESEEFSRYLRRTGIEHLLLNARNAYAFSDTLAKAGTPGSVLVTNALAGRGADIKLGGDPEQMTRQELVEQGEDISVLNNFVYSVATPEQKQMPLYRKYYSILEKNTKLCAADRKTVIEAGGLCVIGTSFFPEPRNEQQTIGRCARQGMVGESWIFRSLEDDSLRELIPEATMRMLENLVGDSDIDVVESPFLLRAIKKAQQQLHTNRFASIRKHNETACHIEEARGDFVGRGHALVDKKIAVEDLLKEWAHDKSVLQELQVLQRGGVCGNRILAELWERDTRLRQVRGFRTADTLFAVAKETVANSKLSAGFLGTVPVRSLLRAWAKYLDAVHLMDSRTGVQAPATKKLLAEKKRALLRQPVEEFLQLAIHWG